MMQYYGKIDEYTKPFLDAKDAGAIYVPRVGIIMRWVW
jgi:hypothetical protein